MDYEIIVTETAENRFDEALQYLIYEKKNKQAACNLLSDFERTKNRLGQVAESLRLCENETLKDLGYRRINFIDHRYFMLYRVEGKKVFIDQIFHEENDCEVTNMAIIVNIDVMLAKRKMSVTELSEKLGITMANVSILKNGKAKAVKIETLNKLCKALDCQPGDLFAYEEDQEEER